MVERDDDEFSGEDDYSSEFDEYDGYNEIFGGLNDESEFDDYYEPPYGF